MTSTYVTPDSGQYAGQLGPWSQLVSAVGIEPRSTLMKLIHLVLGTTWVVMIVCFVRCSSRTWWGMIFCAVAGLWYLPFGTMLSLLQILLLMLPAMRKRS